MNRRTTALLLAGTIAAAICGCEGEPQDASPQAVAVSDTPASHADEPRPAASRSEPARTLAQRLGSVFTDAPVDASLPPQVEEVELPSFPGAHAIWGATGRDDRGHLWVGVSAEGVEVPSAHLIQYVPQTGQAIDRGDVVSKLKRAGVYRDGEQQMKIHTRIGQADDGYLYFASMDEAGEKPDGTRLPDWGSHLWRLRLADYQWEHLKAVPEGLIAMCTVGRWVYALGYFDHVLYQFDTASGEIRSLRVGSQRGHISRHFLADLRGHVYVPRLRPRVPEGVDAAGYVPGPDDVPDAWLVELDAELGEVAETPLAHYVDSGPTGCHGIIAIAYLADGSMAFVTHLGYLYRVTPREDGPADVEPVGWIHPDGPSYAAALFSIDGRRYLASVCKTPEKTFEWIVYDLAERSSTAMPLPLVGEAGAPPRKGFLLFGSITRDDAGAFYLGGNYYREKTSFPLLLRVGSL